LGQHTKWVYSVSFGKNGARLASGGADALVKVWDFTAPQAAKSN
jgi:WD40 repeat protein